MEEQEKYICELCGDEVNLEDSDNIHEIDEIASEYFMLDTGTIVHKQCFKDSRTSEYLRKLDDLAAEEEESYYF